MQSKEAQMTLSDQNVRIKKHLNQMNGQAQILTEETQNLFKEIKLALNAKEEEMLRNI